MTTTYRRYDDKIRNLWNELITPLRHLGQRPVFNAVWGVGINAQTAFSVGFVVFVIAFEIHNLTVTFECDDVRCQPIKEPSIVRNNHGASGEFF